MGCRNAILVDYQSTAGGLQGDNLGVQGQEPVGKIVGDGVPTDLGTVVTWRGFLAYCRAAPDAGITLPVKIFPAAALKGWALASMAAPHCSAAGIPAPAASPAGPCSPCGPVGPADPGHLADPQAPAGLRQPHMPYRRTRTESKQVLGFG